MREKLNSNPIAQVALVGVLLVAAGFLLLSTMGGGEEKAEESTTSTTATLATPEGTASVTASLTTPTEAGVAATPTSVPALPPGDATAVPPPPHAVTAAFAANRMVVLLFVRTGGIDDEMVHGAVDRLSSMPRVSAFVVPADHIARYASIAQGVAVDRVPALVVLRPKRLDHGVVTASVHYGFQSPQSVVQAVVDAGYKGRTLDYHP
jgi:hypothetical protein